jgi:hypothetical protein
MAGEFFDNVGRAVSGAPAAPELAGAAAGAPGAVTAPAAPGAPAAAGQVFTAPAKAGGVTSQQDFLKGVAVGAGLVLLGVVVGGLFGRRR